MEGHNTMASDKHDDEQAISSLRAFLNVSTYAYSPWDKHASGVSTLKKVIPEVQEDDAKAEEDAKTEASLNKRESIRRSADFLRNISLEAEAFAQARANDS